PELLRLGLTAARRHQLIVRAQAQAASALARRALRAQGASRANGRGELDVDGLAAVRLDRDAPLHRGVALRADGPLGGTVDGKVSDLELIGRGVRPGRPHQVNARVL